MSGVLVYQDYIHNNGVLERCLRDYFGAGAVAPCDAADIAGGALRGARLLVVPGGADRYHCEKLNGAGNSAIRAFVEGGGGYLGICGGAYYACAALDWAKGSTDPVSGARELGFYTGTAAGPVGSFMEDGSIEGCWDGAAAVEWNGAMFPVLYSAGPLFSGDKEAEVLARYAALPGRPAATVACRVGAGHAVLCSPHPEYDADSYARSLYRHGNRAHAWQERVAQALSSGDAARQAWREALFARAWEMTERRDAGQA